MKVKLLLAMLSFGSIANAQTYSFTTSTPIPDGVTATSGCGTGVTQGMVSTMINVPITATISDPTKVTVNLDLAHVWLGDVVAQITAPGGTNCALIKRIGSTNDTSCGDSSDFGTGNVLSFNATNTTLIDAATPGAAASIPAGMYAPTGGAAPFPAISLCNMSTFLNGLAVNGNWMLTLYDLGNGDVGTLNSWQLVFTTGFDLDTQDFLFTKRISVLGNPFNETLTLKLNEPGNTLLRIYSIDGKEVFTKSYTANDVSQNINIDSSSWQQGIYVLVPEVEGKKLNAIKLAKK